MADEGWVLTCTWDDTVTGDGHFTGPHRHDAEVFATEGQANDAHEDVRRFGMGLVESRVFRLPVQPGGLLAGWLERDAIRQATGEEQVLWCPTHYRYVLWLYGSGPGFTGAPIMWGSATCGCQVSDTSADNLEAAR